MSDALRAAIDWFQNQRTAGSTIHDPVRHGLVLLDELLCVTQERDTLDGELTEALGTSTKRIGEIAMLREQLKRCQTARDKAMGVLQRLDRVGVPAGEFKAELGELLHLACRLSHQSWATVLVLWAAEMWRTGDGADVSLRRLIDGWRARG